MNHARYAPESFDVTCIAAAAGHQKLSAAWLGFRFDDELVAIERESAGSASSASTYQALPGLPRCMSTMHVLPIGQYTAYIHCLHCLHCLHCQHINRLHCNKLLLGFSVSLLPNEYVPTLPVHCKKFIAQDQFR
jgi:hypothetical protein